MHRAENLTITGPSGTGKTHFVEALAHRVIDASMRVSRFTRESLTAAIGRASVDGSIAKTINRITRAELIVVDDIGMLPSGQAAAEALYRLVDASYERRRGPVAAPRPRHRPRGHLHAPERGYLRTRGRAPELTGRDINCPTAETWTVHPPCDRNQVSRSLPVTGDNTAAAPPKRDRC